MNTDIIMGDWKQIRGNLKQWWEELNEDDVTFINGNAENLLGRLQERYGWTRERAETEVRKRLS